MLEETYITIKYHKSEFPNKIPCRLINPTRSSFGKISEVILGRVNEIIISSVTMNQWKNILVVLKWYNKIPINPLALIPQNGQTHSNKDCA